MLRRSNFFVTALALLASALTASAGTYKVDTMADSPSAKPGDGKCVSKAGGCSLRAAVQEANASDVGSTISVPSGTYTLSIPPEGENYARSGSLYLAGEITITGQDFLDTIIDGGGVDRVFQIDKSSTINISGVTVRNGAAKGGNGGGIQNRGNLTMTESIVAGNKATADPGQSNGRGGGLHNEASATLRTVTFDGNQADGRGGGIYNETTGVVEMVNGRVTSNASLTDDGGGILNEGKLSLSILPVRENRGANGGGIDNVEGTLLLFDVLLADNVAGASGGGLRNSGAATLTNVTAGANQAGVSGGAIDNRAKGKLQLNNVTIARNTAATQSTGTGGGIQNAKEASVAIANSIVAGNKVGKAKSDCEGVLASKGYNLIGTQAGCILSGNATGDQLDVAPGMARLALNGGPTPTYGFKANSPAVDAGNPAKPTGSDGSCAEADQRGVKRPQAGKPGAPARCDIGAFELKPAS